MSTVYLISMEVRSGGERIGCGKVYASGSDEEQAREVAAQVIYDQSLLWDDRFPDKSLHFTGTVELNRRDVPTCDVLYGPDILPSPLYPS